MASSPPPSDAILYSCLIVPLQTGTKRCSAVKLQTADSFRLMFFFRHSKGIDRSGNEARGAAVVIRCKCFCKVAPQVEMSTVFRLRCKSEDDFDNLLSTDEVIVNKRRLEMQPRQLSMYSIEKKSYIDNRALVTSQTNIFSALNTSFVKCNSDPVTWYICTASRMVVGDKDEMPYPYPTIVPYMLQYNCSSKTTVVQTASKRKNAYDDIFATYTQIFGGDKLMSYVDLATETLRASCLAAGRFGDIYNSYNTDRVVTECPSVTYANLEFFSDMHARFPSVLSLLMSITDSRNKDQEYVDSYRRKIKTLADRGGEDIRKYIRDTTRFRQYDPRVHSSYEYDETTGCDTNGLTPNKSCGQISLDIMKGDPFPNSLCKQIKGTTVAAVSYLCNSDRTLLMTGEKVKSILHSRLKMPINTPFFGVPIGRGFQFCRLINPQKLRQKFTHNNTLRLVKRHIMKPSMDSYNAYSRSFDTNCPKIALNEIINLHMPVYSVCIDVDSKELVRSFYNTEVSDSWPVRARIIKGMEDAMTEFLSIVDQTGQLGDNRREFVMYAYESKPERVDIVKVGLRFIYKFKHLVFKNTEVLYNFLVAFKFFLSKKIPAVAFYMDMKMLKPSAGMLRTAMSRKLINNTYCRQLMPLFVSQSFSFVVAQTLFHTRHGYLAKDDVMVLDNIGNITNLIKSARAEEFTLQKKVKKARLARAPVLPSDGCIGYFKSILESRIMPAIWASGGGYDDEILTDVRRKAGHDFADYDLFPRIHWCTIRAHRNPQGNPCRYYIRVNRDEGTFSLCMFCFGCTVDRDILVDRLPFTGTAETPVKPDSPPGSPEDTEEELFGKACGTDTDGVTISQDDLMTVHEDDL